MEIIDLSQTECWNFVGGGRLGRLGCAKDNLPYIVPLSLAAESGRLYAFTTLGRKVEYLRSNALVCVQFDEIKSPQEWTSIVVQGRCEEITDDAAQEHAFQLLQRRPVWWEPGYVRTAVKGNLRNEVPLYFCVIAEDISGRRGIAGN